MIVPSVMYELKKPIYAESTCWLWKSPYEPGNLYAGLGIKHDSASVYNMN